MHRPRNPELYRTGDGHDPTDGSSRTIAWAVPAAAFPESRLTELTTAQLAQERIAVREIWSIYPPAWPPCYGCGLPAWSVDDLTCGDPACTEAMQPRKVG